MTAVRVEVLRGGRVESVHDVDAALARPGGERAAWPVQETAVSGDPERSVFVRSAIKPFQALPLVEGGAADELGLTDEELALCCASHSGEPEHVAVARRILDRSGLDEGALACGPHSPFSSEAARALERAGEEPGRIHNNCSGKHAGMLALAVQEGWPTDGYHEADHPVQRRIGEVVGRWAGIEPAGLVTAVDGCGVVTFAFPLRHLARAFSRLARAASEAGSPAARILDAMVAYPFMVGGTGRLCTRIIEVTRGRIVAKVGAEGVYGALFRETGAGVALKVRDGARRGAEVALLAVLADLDLLTSAELEELEEWARPELRNTRDEVVGSIRPVVEPELAR